MKALKIETDKYYGESGKTKKEFIKLYKSKKLKMKWISGAEVGGESVDGWFSGDMKKCLIKLPEESGYKRFIGNCEELMDFLKSKGGEEFETSEKGEHIDYDNKLDLEKVEKRIYGEYAGLRVKTWDERKKEMLKRLPEYGIIWTEKSQAVIDNWRKRRSSSKGVKKVNDIVKEVREIKKLMERKEEEKKGIDVKKRIVWRDRK